MIFPRPEQLQTMNYKTALQWVILSVLLLGAILFLLIAGAVFTINHYLGFTYTMSDVITTFISIAMISIVFRVLSHYTDKGHSYKDHTEESSTTQPNMDLDTMIRTKEMELMSSGEVPDGLVRKLLPFTYIKRDGTQIFRTVSIDFELVASQSPDETLDEIADSIFEEMHINAVKE